MKLRSQMENLINQMLEGQIMLNEAISEFEKLYIQNALKRNNDHFSNTAEILGIHRNTLSKRISSYEGNHKSPKRLISHRSK